MLKSTDASFTIYNIIWKEKNPRWRPFYYLIFVFCALHWCFLYTHYTWYIKNSTEKCFHEASANVWAYLHNLNMEIMVTGCHRRASPPKCNLSVILDFYFKVIFNMHYSCHIFLKIMVTLDTEVIWTIF